MIGRKATADGMLSQLTAMTNWLKMLPLTFQEFGNQIDAQYKYSPVQIAV